MTQLKQKTKFAELIQMQSTLQDIFLGILQTVKCKCSELNTKQIQYLFMNFTAAGFQFYVTETLHAI